MLVVLLLSVFLGAAGQVLTRTSTSVTIIIVSRTTTSTGATEPNSYGEFSNLPPCVQATAIPSLEAALNCTKNWPCVCSADYSDALTSLVSVACTQLQFLYLEVAAISASQVFSDFCSQLAVTLTRNYTSSSTTLIDYYITSVPTSGTALFCGTNL